MNKELLYKKGLLLKIVSWENDGDFYKTIEYNVDSIEEAKAIKVICETVFQSCNNGDGGVGNSSDEEDEKETIIGHFLDNKESFKQLMCLKNYETVIKNVEFDADQEFIDDEATVELLYGFINDLSYELMSGSEEGYNFRICESVTLYDIKEDVHLDKTEIKL
tara:strand:- start:356 stop:844 length:489 start_codon:yes stop_codon:yes gene_type:complete